MAIRRILMVCALLSATVCRLVSAQPLFPPPNVTSVVPRGPGSASDTVARIFSKGLSEMWNVPVSVENRPGANGIPGTASVVRANGDGSALLWIASNHIINESLYSNLPYNGLKDLRPIAQVGFAPLILVVPASSRIKNLKDLIRFAQDHPGALNYGSAGSGSTTHLAGEVLKETAKIDIVHVPYKTIGQATTDLIAGRLDMLFLSPPTAMSQINAGTMRAIGTASSQRLAIAPEIATLSEEGLPGFDVQAILGVLAPATMPDDIAERISTDVIRIADRTDVQQAIIKTGLVPHAVPLQEFVKVVQIENELWSRVVKASGATAD